MSANVSRQIQEMRSWVEIAQKAPVWAVVNFFGFFVVFLDFKFCLFLSSVEDLAIVNNLRLVLETMVMLTFGVNCVYNVYYYVWLIRFMQPLELSEPELRIFGIREKELGFKLRKEESKSDELGKRTSSNYPPAPSFEMSNYSIVDRHSSLDSTMLSTRLFDTSLDSTKSPNLSWSLNQTGASSLNSSSQSNGLYKPNASLNGDCLIRRRKFNIASPEELKSYLDNFEKNTNEMNDLVQAEARLNPIMTNAPPSVPPSSPVTPVHANRSFQADSPMNFSVCRNLSLNNSFTGSPSGQFISPGSTESPIVRESNIPDSTYRPAIILSSIPSPECSSSESNLYSSRGVEKMLTKLEVDNAKLNQMVENIRKWISQTILVRLVKEIEANNQKIKEKGYLDSLIGETSIQQLKHLAETKKSELPTLEQLCAFLDVSARNIENNIAMQKYLVRRIRDLAQGGCMSQFFWDGGGSYQYKHWREDMITDSELVLHLFCVYMDSRLLFNPTSPEGKPFTSQHFKACASSQQPKSSLYIEQVKPYPPQYCLVLKGETFEISSGRNNLFYALLVFLHHVKVKNFGLLGRINLGPSGLNIAWVIDK